MKYLIYIIIVAQALLFVTCSRNETEKRNFILNINGIDYEYSVVASYRGITPDTNNKYIKIYGYSAETKPFAACMVGVAYKVGGDGTYALTDYETLSLDLTENTTNKYTYIHLNLGSDVGDVGIDKNIVRYGTNNESGTVEVEVNNDNEYNFYIGRILNLFETGNHNGTRPEEAPKSIELKLDNVYF